METVPSFAHLSDADLTREVARLLDSERNATASLVASLAEFDRRRLYLPLGFSSLFTYCRDALHLGEGAAYRRIEAARACRRYPVILELLAKGSVSLTALSLLSPHLTAANHAALLDEATNQSSREIERIVARLKPKPDVPTVLRRLPVPESTTTRTTPVVLPKPEAQQPSPSQRPFHRSISPLSPERYRLQITMSQRGHDNLRQLQDLMRHSIPSGDAAQVVERALDVLLKDVLRRKCGIVDRPRSGDALDRLIATAP